MKTGTIITHLCDALKAGLSVNIKQLGVTPQIEKLISKTIWAPPVNGGQLCNSKAFFVYIQLIISPSKNFILLYVFFFYNKSVGENICVTIFFIPPYKNVIHQVFIVILYGLQTYLKWILVCPMINFENISFLNSDCTI